MHTRDIEGSGMLQSKQKKNQHHSSIGQPNLLLCFIIHDNGQSSASRMERGRERKREKERERKEIRPSCFR